MKSELFVINSIQSSKRAFSIVSEHVPNRDIKALLKILQNVRKLQQAAMNIGVEYEQIFNYLEKAIVESFNRRTITKLTREHVELLLNADVQHLLSEILSCSRQDALQTLFSIPDLQSTLDYLTDNTISRLPNNAMQLLSEILKPNRAQSLEFDYNTTGNNWEPIFIEEKWLLQKSAELLLKSDKIKNTTTPYQALAELIDQSQEEEVSTSEINLHQTNRIDPLGLIAFRRRLAWIRNRLHDQALEYTDNAAKSMLTSSSIQVLRSILYMYELGYIAKGLRAYIHYSHRLFELLPKDKFKRFEVDQDNVLYNRPLSFSGEALFKLANKEVGTCEITCELRTQRKPQLILRAHDVPAWLYKQLQQDIPNLTPNDLSFSPISDQLCDRLLFTSFPLLDPQIHLLKKAVEHIGTEFVQAVALSNESPIEQIPKLWRELLVSHFPYKDLPAKTDPLYSKGVDQIINQYQNHYNQKHRSFRIIRGIDTSIPNSSDLS